MICLQAISHKLQTRSGQSLMEFLIAIAVGSMLVITAVGAITLLVRTNAYNGLSAQAIPLAQSLIDKAKSVAESNWNNLPKGVTTSQYAVSDGGFKIISGTEGFLNNDITNGLVGYWKLDEAAGTIAYDSTPNNNKGTLTNSPMPTGTASCKIGRCLSFSGASTDTPPGTSDYVSVPTSTTLDLTNKFTISYFVKGANANAPSSYWPPITKGSYQDSGWDSFLLNGSATAKKGPSIRLNDSTLTPTSTIVGCPETDVATNFTQIAITVDLTATPDVVCYVNGVATGTGNFDSAYTTVRNGTQTLRIGTEGGRYMNGLLDDIRIYNRALSDAEVRQLYNSTVFTGSVATRNVCRSGGSLNLTDSDGATTKCSAGEYDPSTEKVTATVGAAGISPITVSTYLTRNRDQSNLFSDWSDPASYDSDSSPNIDTSTPGEIRIKPQ